ncbi:hypothetical protein [Fluviicola taffensis]|nr:hypothetical protein [Fluviicola taffensis]
MKPILLKKATLFFVFAFAMTASYAQQGYQRISGTYYKNSANTVTCGCSTQGLLAYVASDGNAYTMTICFDTEPGSFYEIFNEENITVEGEVKNVLCDNGQSYLVLYVVKSELPIMNRRELVPEFIKQQSNQTKKPGTPSSSKKETMLEGSYMPKGSTMDDWSDYSHCNSCGMLNGNKSQPIIFDRISTVPDYMWQVKVWGIKEGNNFYVTRWETK